MKINLCSLLVQDQSKALKFYTEVLGFVKKTEIPMGEVSWLTVVSPESPDGPELVLEPSANPAASAFQQAMFEQGIPLMSFEVDDIAAEHARMEKLGVAFRSPPAAMGPVTAAVFEDGCGNLIQIYQT